MQMTDQEINEAVARKLGPNRKKHYEQGYDDCHLQNPSLISIEITPDYCHSIEAAWEIVEILTKRHYAVRLTIGETDDESPSMGCECEIDALRDDDQTWIRQFSDIAPMAICLAFLKLP